MLNAWSLTIETISCQQMEQDTKYLCLTAQISTKQCNSHLPEADLGVGQELFGIFIPLLDAKSMGWRRRKSK